MRSIHKAQLQQHDFHESRPQYFHVHGHVIFNTSLGIRMHELWHNRQELAAEHLVGSTDVHILHVKDDLPGPEISQWAVAPIPYGFMVDPVEVLPEDSIPDSYFAH
jgi:hypothetical protein